LKPVNKQSQESIDKKDLDIIFDDLNQSLKEDEK